MAVESALDVTDDIVLRYLEELADFCKGKISTFKIPRYWKFVDGYPMTVTGKVRKIEMREVSVKELGLQSAAAVSTA